MFQIMVVDDDRNTRRLLQAVLEADGYKVLTAETERTLWRSWTRSTSILWCWTS